MTATPMTVETRPFAVEPLTNVMLPDGIFDNALYNLNIACHYTNTSGADLSNVTLYLETVGDPGIAVTAQTYTFATVPAGASVLVSWAANFENASPGKPLVSFIAQADGHAAARTITQIYVSQTRYDQAAGAWTCTIPEGRLEVTRISVIRPGAEGWPDGRKPPFPGPVVPTGLTFTWHPTAPFDGQFGDLPFSDPWWKVLAVIVAFVAAIVGLIAAIAGAGTFSAGVQGTFSEDPDAPNVHCCTPDPGPENSSNAKTVAGACFIIAVVAVAVALSDAADPVYRGEQNTVPAPGELTVSETVDAHWTYTDPPNAGVPYATQVRWHYERTTTGGAYSYDVAEEQVNIHVVDNVEIDTPATVPGDGWLWAEARFVKPGGTLYSGPELYTLCFFRSPGPQGLYFMEPLLDDGRGRDAHAGDGTFTAALNLDVARKSLAEAGVPAAGQWQVFIYAQEVNRTLPGTPPLVAAQTIGGSVVASAVTITFDPAEPCPLKAQATITVL
jgi:hypothetical protein